MSAPQDGGPAFPQITHEYVDCHWKALPQGGMSLRDYFAGQALAGSMSSKATEFLRAAICYQIADAMLAERAKGVKP